MFNKVLKWVSIAVLCLILIFAAFFIYVQTALPNIKSPDITVEITPDRIARGQYLANNVMGCIDCHSKKLKNRESFPHDPSSIGAGGFPFDEKNGFTLGAIYPSNLTPYNLKDWTDGEIYRAIVNGIGKDNHVLFPIMPYMNFSKLAKEDIYSVIAYLRTLEPIKSEHRQSEISFPMSFIMKLAFPTEAQHRDIPPRSDKVKLGEYLVTAGTCIDCHTPYDGGQPVLDSMFAGGFELITPTGRKIQSSNITPDKETGIGNWTEEYFISKFALFRDPEIANRELKSEDIHTEMPWATYSGMKDEDLSAIYSYLMSLKPIKKVIKKGNY